ncbi:unnamed protein product, partial [Cuscuta campestris]
QCTLPGMSFAF